MVKTLKTKPTESVKKAPAKKATPKKETPKIEPKAEVKESPKKAYGKYMDENGTIDWDKLKALLK